jgi:methyl-accepting chemotaxis protein
MQKALAVYSEKTLPAFTEVKEYFHEAIAAEEALQRGYEKANNIYADKTQKNLESVQGLLGQIRKEARNYIMTDEVMLDAAQGTQRNVSIVGAAAVVIGILLAFFIARGITRVLGLTSESLDEAAGQVSAAAGQVSAASQSLAEGASENAAALEETSSSLEEMSSMTRQNAENASQADSLMNETKETVGRAADSMKQMTTSVEAARAGEAGAGFAVVADEVRNLAMRAAEAAKNTSELIEDTIQKIEQGNQLVKSTDRAFGEVTDNAEKAAELVGEIAAASKEQAQGIDQINQAVTQMDQVTQQNAANAEESAGASEQLNAQAETMKDSVDDLMKMVGGGRTRGRSGAAAQPARTPARTKRLEAPHSGYPAVSTGDDGYEDF